MSRKPIIAANWKMNIGPAEGAQFIESFKNLINGKDVSCDVVIIPPFTTIPSVQNALGGCSCIAAGAQNVSQYDNGAYTGEISTSMLNELGLKYVVLGHSERRQYFGETDAIINAKIKKAIAAGITPIFCIGETKDERLGGILEPVLEIQLKGGLKDLTPEEVSNLVIAYEPVWAIGTGLTATSKEAQEAHSFIRKVISDVFGTAPQQTTPPVMEKSALMPIVQTVVPEEPILKANETVTAYTLFDKAYRRYTRLILLL